MTVGAVSIAQGRQRLLLAVLLVYANEPVSSERLIDALWSDPPPSSAARGLHNLVSGLRKGLGEGHLLTEAHGYRLCVADEDLDASRFLALCARGRAAQAEGQPREPRTCSERRSPSGAARPSAIWRPRSACGRSKPPGEHRLTAVEDRIEAELALGPQRELVAEIEALVAAHPLRERLREYQMLALYRSGRQADALAAYAHTRHHFVTELGIEPGPALRELEQAVLDQDPALSCPPALPMLPHAPVSAARRPWRMAVAGAVLLAVAIAAALAIDDAERPPTPAAAAQGTRSWRSTRR